MWKLWRAAVAEPQRGATSIEEAFQMLRVRDRALLWLAYVEEASHTEIAADLGCGARSVRVLLFRARRRMERILREQNICSRDEL
jgi:RNA polymerase sigma-70 factor (ECF subfamily)